MLIKTILCADIGTSSLKAALIDLDGHSWAFARKVYPHRDDGALARDWEDALRLCLCAFQSAMKADVSIAGVCVSGNGPTLVPFTFNDEALTPLHWHNRRVAPLPSMKSLFLPHAAWFQAERPGDYDRTRRLFSSHEWLAFRLGASPVSALPSAAYRPYYWDEAQCRAAGLHIDKFPPFVNMGTMIGRVSAQAGYRFNLPEGIPIIAGASDFITALIGVGAISPGLVCDRAGTSEGINLCSAAPIQSKELRVLPHAVDGLWNIGGLIPQSGSLFDQYRARTGQDKRDYAELLDELIPDSSVSDTADTRFSMSAGRSTLETIGFKVRLILDQFKRHGLPLTEMRVSGGQSKNPRWNQLKANITDCALLVPEVNDGELTGNAALAALALGEASCLSQAVERMIRIKRRFTPNPGSQSLYAERYQAWLDAAPAP